jgi:hypothetical protein
MSAIRTVTVVFLLNPTQLGTSWETSSESQVPTFYETRVITISQINRVYVITDGLCNNYSNINRPHIFATLNQVGRSSYGTFHV